MKVVYDAKFHYKPQHEVPTPSFNDKLPTSSWGKAFINYFIHVAFNDIRDNNKLCTLNGELLSHVSQIAQSCFHWLLEHIVPE